MNGVWLSLFTAKNVYSDIILRFYFVILFLRYQECDSIIVKLINHLFVNSIDPLRVRSLRIQEPYVTPSKAFILVVFLC